ncbi:hypothetical protein ACLOJK_014583 [Asimina triloba]
MADHDHDYDSDKSEDAPQLAPPRLDLVEPPKSGSMKMVDKLPRRQHLLIGCT